ncbi:MAG: DUF3854 domain-containing protein [Actinobacteria bacterium]|nr:DUF3854 domain-containing protein [Actinomycetota bacterium]MCA1721595.1 DUF3854 domain-containing protein [Actinomycetota bacterium]
MSDYGLRLFEQHAELLRASAIPVSVANERAYTTVDTKARLTELGFSSQQTSVPGLLIPLLDMVGNTIGFQYRPDQPRERGGKTVKYETPPGQANHLDVPPGVGALLGDPAVDLWITEGTRKADAAAALGLACVSLSGVWNWRGRNGQGGKVALPDWHDVALNGRKVVLAFDSDSATNSSVAQALDALSDYLGSKGAIVQVCTLSDGGDSKTGLDDYIAAGHDRGDLQALVENLKPTTASGGSSTRGGRHSTATALVELVLNTYRLGISTDGHPFAIPLTPPHVVRPLAGDQQGLRATMADTYYVSTGRVPSSQALTEALTALEGRARQQTPEVLHLRVGAADDATYLDLGDTTGRAVQIDRFGWRIVDQPPLLFRRTQLTSPLPEPQPGGALDELWDQLNVVPADRPLVLAFLIAALMPGIPHPILALRGEQGSGKSTATVTVSAIFDPSPAQARKPPRDVEGWVTAASGSWVIAIDNVSGMPDWWSDSLCRAVTGEGDVRRKLYKDGDLFVFNFRRVVIINGIDLGAIRDDLADRLLTIELARIDDRARRLDADLSERWAHCHPRLLGAVLDLAVQVLKVLPTVKLTSMPRMADFARVVAAVDMVLQSDGLARYRRQGGDLALDAVESDPVLSAIVKRLHEPWTGTGGELKAMLEPAFWSARPPKGWPENARDMTALLRRRAPSLRKLGWTVEDLPRGGRNNQVRFQLAPPALPTSGDAGPGGAGDDAGDSVPVRATTAERDLSPAPNARAGQGLSPATTSRKGAHAGDAGDPYALPLLSVEKEEDGSASLVLVQVTTGHDPLTSPVTPAEAGPCGRCHVTPVIRYGPRAEPICPDCRRQLNLDAAS